MAAPTLDQTVGSIMGLALGDALGAVVEADPPGDARRYVDEVLRAGRAGTLGRRHHPFGQVTDDTQLARELLRSIADRGDFDPADFAEKFMEFVMAGRLVGGGPASRTAAKALAEGTPWQRAGMPAPYAGNGAAMRAGPLGVLYGHDLTRLTQVAVQQARVSHQDPRAIAGALAIAGAAAIAARQAPIVPADFLAEVGRLVASVDAGVASTISTMDAWVRLGPDEASRFVHEQGIEPGGDGRWLGISSFVTSSVCWSLYAFLRSPDAWWDAVCLAIQVGGDTDTLGAMTGSIVGARRGASALPENLVVELHDGPHWRAPELRELARRCHELRVGQG